jgi:hypothetical protein
MPAEGAIRVRGLRELNRAFARADRKLRLEKNDALKRAAEPVRADAEAMAVAGISRIGVPWSRMRVGVTMQVVYVAPKQRASRANGRLRRPKLAPLLMDRAMQPALDRNRDEVVRRVDALLDTVGREWDHG